MQAPHHQRQHQLLLHAHQGVPQAAAYCSPAAAALALGLPWLLRTSSPAVAAAAAVAAACVVQMLVSVSPVAQLL
jgi:hypothetical protein